MREAERIADRHDPVARLHLRRIAELHFDQVALLLDELNQRAVGQRIAADDLGLVIDVVVFAEEVDFDLGRAFDDVVVGEDVAERLVDDEAGAGRLRFLFARPLRLPLPAALAAEETLEQVVVAAAAAAEELGHLLGALFRGAADVHDRGRHRLGDVAERARVDRTAERRAVHRRRRQRCVPCADEAGVRSSREAITIPTASEATMIKNE